MNNTRKNHRIVVYAPPSATEGYLQASQTSAQAGYLTAFQRAILDASQDRIHVFDLVRIVQEDRGTCLYESAVIERIVQLVSKGLLRVA